MLKIFLGIQIFVICSLLIAHAAGLSSEVKKRILTKKNPVIACSAEEAARLRTAWERGKGAEFNVVAAKVKRAKAALKRKITYPPRGGQHNQWYQCDHCELPLKTTSPTQHQCPQCKKIYSGYPYDDVIFSRVHYGNLRKMNDAAWAWLITGDKVFAVFAKEVLLGYAERYKKYPFHGNSKWNFAYNLLSGGHLFEQTLNEACAMSRIIAPAYDLVKASGVLTKGDDEKINNGLLVPMLQNIDKYRQGKNNWQSWHNAALIWGGAVVRQPDLVERAIYSPAHGFIRQMEISILKDGMWYEGSWSYHFYAQQALIIAAEGARELGIDLWAQPQMKKTFTYPLNWRMAGSALPRFGDSVSPSLRRCRYLWEPAYHAYRDEAFLPLLASHPSWQSVFYGRKTGGHYKTKSLKSIVFQHSGHAVLRSKGPAELAASVTFGPHGGYHGHYDKLGFVLYGYGQELAVDPGRAASLAYRLPIHKQWYKASISHNVIVIDKESQRGCAGKVLLFKNDIIDDHGQHMSILLLENNNAYPGVRHKRLIILTENFLFTMDQLSSQQNHNYDWIYHNHGNSISSNQTFLPGKVDSGYAGMQYLKNIKTATCDNELIFEIAGKAVSTWVLPSGARGTRYWTATGPGASVNQRIPMIIIRRTGQNAVFSTVIEPVKHQTKRIVQSVQGVDRSSVVIQFKKRKQTISLNDKAVVIDKRSFSY